VFTWRIEVEEVHYAEYEARAYVNGTRIAVIKGYSHPSLARGGAQISIERWVERQLDAAKAVLQ
jgi:hypothetical protein